MQISSSISTTHQLARTREGYNHWQATDQSWSDQSISGLCDFGSIRQQAWEQLEKAMTFFPHQSTSNMKCADQQQSSSDYRKSSLLQANDMVNLHNYEDLAAATATGAYHPTLNLSQTGGNWVNTVGDTFKNVGLLQEGMSHTAFNYQLQEGNYSPSALKYKAYSPSNYYNYKGAGSSANSAVFTAGNAVASVHGTDDRRLHESEKGQLMHMSGHARIGLNLGGRTYFAPDDYARFGERLVGVGSTFDDGFGFGKRLKPGPLCQVDACQTDLSSAKRYHRRHKVCDSHSKAAAVMISHQAQRFCQQCSRFHTLSEFDDGKRSCRKRLANHNKRRRKPPRPPISILSKSIPTTLIDHKNDNELCKEMKVAS